jgi:hypothetical protein
MIGIAENDVGTCVLHLIEIEGLDRAGGPDRHEGGGADIAMPGVDQARPGSAIGRQQREGKFRSHAAGNSRLASP